MKFVASVLASAVVASLSWNASWVFSQTGQTSSGTAITGPQF
ncbi:hypothetical protein OV090_40780 [Nannocystis sp. RBIL2]|nr:hypothetical protein [Nannocystis sp. RBIL2]MCY1071149.1 hypothetical protein [Nannocystis sp. RBIL2]